MPITGHFTPTSPRRIELLAFPRVQLLDVAGPLQVFATANDLAVAAGKPAPYDPVVVSKSSQITASAGLALATHALPSPETPLDTLMIAGGFGVQDACNDSEILDWVKHRAQSARRVASVCSGAFLLATAGLLDGRRAVTHWQRCSEFARRFPEVRLEPDPIFVQDGKFWTSAGITAGIDLALALLENDLGHDASLAVARQLVVFLKRPGGQAQFSTALERQQGDARFEQLHGWIASHLDADLSVPALARMAGMSPRNFVRRYREASNSTPARAVEQMRVEAARQMLERSQPVKRVATRCGFGSEETMRRSFMRHLGTSPREYRERFSHG